MFYEVRILDRQGKVKKVLSSKALSKKYWKSFFENPGAAEPSKKPKGKKGKFPGENDTIGYQDLYLSDS